MPRTPAASRPIERTSSSEKRIPLPFLVTIRMSSSPEVNTALTSSSLSRSAIAMKPSLRDLSYSASAVFFTCPNFVANIRYPPDSKSLVATSAWIVSSGASGSRLTAGVPRAVRSFIGTSCAAQPEDTSLVREQQQVGKGGRVDGDADEVLFFEPRTLHSPAATSLGPESVRGDRLYVTGARHRDDDLLVLDEVLDTELAGIVGDYGPAWLGELLPDLAELLGDDRAELRRITQDRLQLGDRRSRAWHALLRGCSARGG